MREELKDLSPEKRELLLKRLRDKRMAESHKKEGRPGTSIGRCDRSANLPLSFAQERLWFLHELESQVSASAYNIPASYRLRGTLNVAALQQALNEILRRHEALRTTFAEEGGQPFQRINETLFLPLTIKEITRYAKAGEQEQEIMRIAAAFAREEFDLANGPLIRWSLLHLPQGNSADEHILLITTHHIISDGWSSGIIVAEASTLYEAYVQGKPSPLQELAIQYPDFAAWQRTRFSDGPQLEQQITYWKKQLHGAPPVLDLPCRKTRPQEQSYRGKQATFRVEQSVRQLLETIGKDAGATPFMTLMSIFSVLLSRYGGGDDIVIGSPIANRGNRDLEPLIGFFVNTLAFRIDLAGDPTFRYLLEAVRERALEAYANQELPFEKLVKELAPSRNLSYAPLFQVMFVLHSAPVINTDEPQELQIDTLPVESGVSHFDMVMYMSETENGYDGMLEYSCDLFEQGVITSMIDHFQVLLAAVAASPDRPLASYPLFGKDERQQIIQTWSHQRSDFAVQVPTEALFEIRAADQADAPAVVFEGKILSYGELNTQANQLAHYLIKKGVVSDTVVGLMMDRSDAIVVAILAILKAGGGYMPIDPDYPFDRISTMLTDSGAALLLADRAVDVKQGVEVLHLGNIREILAACDGCNPQRTHGIDSLAYLLYTSGSTGTPKGVEMTRFPLSNLVHWHLDHEFLSIPCPTLQFAPFTFDVSFQEVFSTLCSGGTLHVASTDMRRDPQAMLAYIDRQKIERLFLPYVALQQMAANALELSSYPRSVKDIITAGEQVRISPAIRSLFSILENCRFHNHYGPCESHVVTTFIMDQDTADWPLLPDIGKPIANAEIYILDQSYEPVPAGVPGELYIGGGVLARGYMDQPAMTAKRFIVNPFSDDKASRIYKTGDMALWQACGNIKFLGRADNQVKIRGFRIEPGEIEAVLNANPQVDSSVVIDIEYGPGDRRLAAYVTASDGRGVDCPALRAYLKAKLPDYMIPQTFQSLQRFPVTSSGKIDRLQLPHPDEETGIEQDASSRPTTPVEDVLVAIWAEILGKSVIGVNDNFFEIGGHSLLATQLISRIREAFPIDIQVRQIFESPTVAQLAHYIEAAGNSDAGDIPPIIRIPRDGQYSLSFAQERLWFLDQLEGDSANYNMSAALHISGDLDREALRRSISEIVRRHEVLRTTFHETDGHAVARIAAHQDLPLPVVDLGACQPGERQGEIQDWVTRQSISRFNLQEDPPLKGTLLKISAENDQDEAYILLLAMHHIVADNWSSGVFIDELTKLYDAYRQHQEGTLFNSPLAELDVQYVDFANWQRQWLTSNTLETQLSYWRNQLAGAPQVLELSRRRPDKQVTAACHTHMFALGPATSDKIRKLCLHEGVSLYMGLLAAFMTLLYRYGGREDIVVGSPIANRNHKEIEPLIGFFVNTLALRVDLSGEPSYRDLMKRVRQITLEAFQYQDIPFERIVREVCPDRGDSRTPLVQVVFALQNATVSDIALEGVSMTMLPTPRGAAKFDLVLSMMENEGALHGIFEYDSSLFNEAEITAMSEHFIRIMDEVTASPDTKVVDISLTTNDAAKTADEAEEFSF
jgi:amino acid adenylation domain-containing protein